jgi:alkylhydroperoxidase family enzyme
VDLHSRNAKKLGETDERLALVCVWPEATCFTPRERAALRWNEALTRLAGGHVTNEDFTTVSAEFSEAEVTNLTLAIVMIDGWTASAWPSACHRDTHSAKVPQRCATRPSATSAGPRDNS